MAIVTRRYQMVGPTDAEFTKYVGHGAVRNTLFGGAVSYVDIDDAVGGAVETLNEFMELKGFRFDAVATPPALLGAVNAFTRHQYSTPVALAYAANMDVYADLSNSFSVTLTGVTAQLNNPINVVAGMSFSFAITQDGTGGRALTFGTNYSFGAIGTPVISTSLANITDFISCYALSPTKILCSVMRGFA